MDNATRENPLYIPYAGSLLLESPLLNKGSGFTQAERDNFNLHGLIPATVESIEEQAQRAWLQFQDIKSDIARHIYLRNIQDINETLFYHLVEGYLPEMLPIIYTPVVGLACEHFSAMYRRPRGLFISWEDRYRIDDILHNASRQNVRVIVVTDGERILGLGDQGMGGMGIPIGKLSLYTVCGGIAPEYSLPIFLDVGTNNPRLLNDPLYMGRRHPRITGEEYFEFIDLFIRAVKQRWPEVLLQFEDFAQQSAMPLLERYRDELCCFNDDIQGTAAVTLGAVVAASHATGRRVSEQTVVFLGAGSAGCGIAEQIVTQMVAEGLSETQARARIYMVDRAGLLTEEQTDLLAFQARLSQPLSRLKGWQCEQGNYGLQEVVRHAQPTILIGVSGQPGLFSEAVITEMYRHCRRPIIMPLSNPDSRVEARPEDILAWTEGRAIVATGSPFAPVQWQGESYPVTQCNNVYIFPGIGLGVMISGARRVTDGMLMAASRTLAEYSPLALHGTGLLLPDISQIQSLTQKIAVRVAQAAQQDGIAAELPEESLWARIADNFWRPRYRQYRRTPF
ncbi:NAD-dependent malic enzyme [Raoultella sp. BIGb0138]|nr:NAD-dependent malic enzyme [Raoultella sp. BIGb0138]